jgi:Ca2+-binding EF-hand superfamily protein
MKTPIVLMLATALGVISAEAQNSSDKSQSASRAKPSSLAAALDANGDGTIDAGEIANASKALLRLDANKDGILSDEELHPASTEKASSDGRKVSRTLLAALDVNRDGKLDPTEIAQANKSLLNLDTDGDGKLSKDELKGRKGSDSDDRPRRDGSGDHVAKPGENKPY